MKRVGVCMWAVVLTVVAFIVVVLLGFYSVGHAIGPRTWSFGRNSSQEVGHDSKLP